MCFIGYGSESRSIVYLMMMMNFHVKFEVITSMTMKNTVFWDMMPHSLVEVYQCFGGAYCLHLQCSGKQSKACWLLVCLPYSSALNMDAVCSSEMSVNFYHATQHHILQDEFSVRFDLFSLMGLNNFHAFKINIF
jgi:hypothetical protein